MWVVEQAERKASERKAKGPPTPAPADELPGASSTLPVIRAEAAGSEDASGGTPSERTELGHQQASSHPQNRKRKNPPRDEQPAPKQGTSRDDPSLSAILSDPTFRLMTGDLPRPGGLDYFRHIRGIQNSDVDPAMLGLSRDPCGIWGFDRQDCGKFPVLVRKRNFWCVQRHQATALHYDLRMQLDGTTFCWAIPKGLIGMTRGESRLAVETPPHPISYTVFEGSDGRRTGRDKVACGTLLWDVGEYHIDEYNTDAADSDSESDGEMSAKKKGKRRDDGNEDVDDGAYEENKFRHAMIGPLRSKGFNASGDKRWKTRSVHFTLRGGQKLTNHSFILIRSGEKYKASGERVNQWLLKLTRGGQGYQWPDAEGEEGIWGLSVKTGRTFKQVCTSTARPYEPFQGELQGSLDEAALDM